MSLTKWFKEDWVDIGASKKNGQYQSCGRGSTSSKRSYPKCVPRSRANTMSKNEIRSAVARKRSKKQGVGGKPTNVKTFAKTGGKIEKQSNMGLFGRI